MITLVIKYCSIWLVMTAVALGISWLIVSFMPDSGWLYWTSIVLLIIGWLLYLVLCVILLVVYYIESHEAEIKGYFRDFGNGLLEAFNKAWEMYGNLFWFGKFQ